MCSLINAQRSRKTDTIFQHGCLLTDGSCNSAKPKNSEGQRLCLIVQILSYFSCSESLPVLFPFSYLINLLKSFTFKVKYLFILKHFQMPPAQWKHCHQHPRPAKSTHHRALKGYWNTSSQDISNIFKIVTFKSSHATYHS